MPHLRTAWNILPASGRSPLGQLVSRLLENQTPTEEAGDRFTESPTFRLFTCFCVCGFCCQFQVRPAIRSIAASVILRLCGIPPMADLLPTSSLSKPASAAPLWCTNLHLGIVAQQLIIQSLHRVSMVGRVPPTGLVAQVRPMVDAQAVHPALTSASALDRSPLHHQDQDQRLAEQPR